MTGYQGADDHWPFSHKMEPAQKLADVTRWTTSLPDIYCRAAGTYKQWALVTTELCPGWYGHAIWRPLFTNKMHSCVAQNNSTENLLHLQTSR